MGFSSSLLSYFVIIDNNNESYSQIYYSFSYSPLYLFKKLYNSHVSYVDLHRKIAASKIESDIYRTITLIVECTRISWFYKKNILDSTVPRNWEVILYKN
jgi:hypothetical protein